MGKRFDEIELHGVSPDPTSAPYEPPSSGDTPERYAGFGQRFMAFAIDLSLFVAAAVALSPLIPEGPGALSARLAVGGFLVLISLFYMTLGWTIWGKTIGGAIADVKVVSRTAADVDIYQAARRWAGTILSLLTAGLGFVPALFGDRRSLADRISNTRVVS